jgi:hypothetical protein
MSGDSAASVEKAERRTSKRKQKVLACRMTSQRSRTINMLTLIQMVAR